MGKIASHKIRLNPTPEQADYLRKSADVARFTWNWALGWYNEGVPLNVLKLEFNRIRREESWYKFVSDVPTHTNQQAFTDLRMAVNRYFDFKKRGDLKPPKGCKPRKDGKPFGWPRFKSRFRSTPSFYQVGSNLKIDGHWLRMPKLETTINMTESLRFQGKINSARFSYSGGYWWASFSIETDIEPKEKHVSGAVAGVDLGVSHLAFVRDSSGNDYVIPNPKPLEKSLKKLAKLQKKYDNQQRANNPHNYNDDGTVKPLSKRDQWIISENMKKTLLKIQRAHARVANIRNDAAHKMTHQITRDYSVIGIEDLSIKDLLMHSDMPRQLSDAALYEKRRQLEYKAKWNGGNVIALDSYFPSNQLCQCGHRNNWVTYKMHVWICDECQAENHRRKNSAKNIYQKTVECLAGEAVLPGSTH